MKTPRRTRAQTMRAEWLRAAEQAVAASPDKYADRYHNDPVAYCRERLGFEPWEGQQEVLRALAAEDNVSVPAGRAVGKSRLDGAAALWFADTRPGSRVILTAPTFKQVQHILWEEIRILWMNAAQHGLPFHGDIAKMASTGLRLANGSQIIGITAERPEAFQGIRAPQMLVIADEASGIDDAIFHVIDGNTAGGGKKLYTGNPTRALGAFRESMRSPLFRCIPLSSEDSPNVKAGQVIIRGIATREWVEERRREWGVDSPLYKIHVLGQVVEAEEGRLFSAEMIAAAESRWSETKPTGRLVVAIDPAGAGDDGDESAFACRRGKRVVKIHARRGLTEEGHIVEALGLIALHRGDSAEMPLVVIDRDGYVGARVYAAFSAYLQQNEGVFQLLGVRGGERARRKPLVYDRVRDEVWFNLVDAFRDGLTIPEDVKLARELEAIRSEVHISGRSKVTQKDDLRKELGRSPDRADALALVCVEVVEWAAAAPTVQQPVQHNPYLEPVARGMDPYAAMDVWSRR